MSVEQGSCGAETRLRRSRKAPGPYIGGPGAIPSEQRASELETKEPGLVSPQNKRGKVKMTK